MHMKNLFVLPFLLKEEESLDILFCVYVSLNLAEMFFF